jgi:hypothetical protein
MSRRPELTLNVDSLANAIVLLSRRGAMLESLLLRICFSGVTLRSALQLGVGELVSSINPITVDLRWLSKGILLDLACKRLRGGTLADNLFKYVQSIENGLPMDFRHTPAFIGVSPRAAQKRLMKLRAKLALPSALSFEGARVCGKQLRMQTREDEIEDIETFLTEPSHLGFAQLLMPGKYHEQEEAVQQFATTVVECLAANDSHLPRPTAVRLKQEVIRRHRKDYWEYHTHFVSESVLTKKDARTSFCDTQVNGDEIDDVEVKTQRMMELRQLINDELTASEKEVIQHRFDLNGRTQSRQAIKQELAASLNGLTVEQVEFGALKKLRNAVMQTDLREYKTDGRQAKVLPRWLRYELIEEEIASLENRIEASITWSPDAQSIRDEVVTSLRQMKQSCLTKGPSFERAVQLLIAALQQQDVYCKAPRWVIESIQNVRELRSTGKANRQSIH